MAVKRGWGGRRRTAQIPVAAAFVVLAIGGALAPVLAREHPANEARINILRHRERVLELIMTVFVERLWQDLSHGCRMLAKNPAFTLVAVISLAIGIGANCATYSWADALLLRPLPVARPSDVISVGTKVSLAGFSSLVNSYLDFRDLRDRTRSLDNLTAFTDVTVGLTTKPDALPQMKLGVLATSNLFTAMGVEPELGRSFRPDEDLVPGRDAVVVLDHSLWSSSSPRTPPSWAGGYA